MSLGGRREESNLLRNLASGAKRPEILYLEWLLTDEKWLSRDEDWERKQTRIFAPPPSRRKGSRERGAVPIADRERFQVASSKGRRRNERPGYRPPPGEG